MRLPHRGEKLGAVPEVEATILNKAERLRGQFQVNDYAGFKFLQAITLMSRVQHDLERGRYQNVLSARKQTLSALTTGKARAIRFSTLDALCRALDFQPGDILGHDPAAPENDPGPDG